MNTPLEDQVHDALHRRADPIQHAPLTVTDVRHRARRIQRRRTAAAGVAVAAVLAIAIPVGLSATGPSQRSDVPPATQSPSPTPSPTTEPASGKVEVDVDSAEVVTESPVPLLDVDGPSLVTPDGTLDLPEVFDTLTPYLDGYVGVARHDEPGVPPATIEFLGADLRVDDGGNATGGLVVSPDGGRIAWSEYDGTRWRVAVADPTGETERVETSFEPTAEEEPVIPVGFVSADTVAVKAMYNIGETKTFLAGGGQPVEVPGLLQADSASPALGAIAGFTEFRPEGACSGVVDAGGGDPLWTTCAHRLGPFSAGGAYVVGTSAQDDNGSPSIAVLDAATGEEVVTFEAVLPRRTVGGFWTQMTWVGDEAIVARLFIGEDYYMVRLGLDGSVQRIGIDSAGLSGLKVAVPS